MTSRRPFEGCMAQLAARYSAARQPERARAMAAYMRDQFAFFGLSTVERRALDRSVLAAFPAPDERTLATISKECWSKPEREYQYFAADMLRKHIRSASPHFIATLQTLIVQKSWWDTVDTLAAHAVGPLVAAHPELNATMDAWIASENIWLARTAILHQLAYKSRTDEARLFDYCLRRSGDTEFFLRKAIGWALREYSKTAPDAVARFVEANTGRLSKLSQREAMKRMGKG